MNTLKGSPVPLGFSLQGEGGNFAVFSSSAKFVTLGLFQDGEIEEWPMHRTGDVWHLAIDPLPKGWLYAFRCDSSTWLSDPYAKIPEVPRAWGVKEKLYYSHAEELPPFDWQGDQRPQIPKEQLIIYEMHVRGFTQHPSSGVAFPGTFLGMIEKIPYLKKLGVNAVELMPIFEFDEIHSKDIQPHTGEPLPNYWGYNTLFFFAPMRRYAATDGIFSQIQEFKTLVRELHANGIEVILDVVYNHTGEGNEKNYFVHFRGLDNAVYYMLDAHGNYCNYTGCGNTVNANHPVVRRFILESLRYWIEEMHIDGVRFDLASIFTRGDQGLIQEITDLCKSHHVKCIAEAWDAAGLYQVGYFPNHFGYWADWNGRYRDTVRRFIKGTPMQVGAFADALCGSQSIYGPSHTPCSSVNFITAHDGYTIRDLVTYQMKHNYENGEMNQDGASQNDNWNCGAEGPTLNGEIAQLRERQMRNFFLALFVSQGIPMLLMGDEYGHSRRGNNNPFVQDNELNWFLWNLLEKSEKIFDFVASLIAFRKTQFPKYTHFLIPQDIVWHHPNWGDTSQCIGATLRGSLFFVFNAHAHSIPLALPEGKVWSLLVRTDEDWDRIGKEGPPLPMQLTLPPYTALLAIDRLEVGKKV